MKDVPFILRCNLWTCSHVLYSFLFCMTSWWLRLYEFSSVLNPWWTFIHQTFNIFTGAHTKPLSLPVSFHKLSGGQPAVTNASILCCCAVCCCVIVYIACDSFWQFYLLRSFIFTQFMPPGECGSGMHYISHTHTVGIEQTSLNEKMENESIRPTTVSCHLMWECVIQMQTAPQSLGLHPGCCFACRFPKHTSHTWWLTASSSLPNRDISSGRWEWWV